MRNVFLSGFYGMQNSGDDALLAVSLWGIKNQSHCNEHIYVTAPCLPDIPNINSKTIPFRKQLTSFNGENGLRDIYYAIKSRSIIHGGGSVFHDDYYITKQLNLLQIAGKGPHYALGVGIGPFHSIKAEKNCAKLLDKLFFVGVRDQESLEIAKGIAPNATIKKTFDLAVLLPKLYGLTNSYFQNEQRSGIGIALCNITDNEYTTANVVKKTIDLICYLVKDGHKDIVLIDFNGNAKYGDSIINSNIISTLTGLESLTRLSYNNSPLALLYTISKLKLLIAMRLHAAVFAYMCKTPTILLSYHNKCTNWAKEIELNNKYLVDCTTFEPQNILFLINDILGNKYIYPNLSISSAEEFSMVNWSHF